MFEMTNSLVQNQRHDPANTTHPSNVESILGQRRRRWASIGPTLDGCVVFAGELANLKRIIHKKYV